MDTREDVQFPAGIVSLADFLRAGRASTHLILVWTTGRKNITSVDPDLWTAFTPSTTLVTVSGSLYPEELRHLVPAFQNINTLNNGAQHFITSGYLNDFSRFIPRNVTRFLFDSRRTSNATLIENVMAFYGDLFMRQRDREPCFRSLTLIRLSEMLIDDESSAAVVYTMTPGDDTILELLLALEFKRGHAGYLMNYDKFYQKFDFWTTTVFGKTVTFGFLDPKVSPVPENKMVKL